MIACSGGPDSMAAVEILFSLGYPFGIAHCNFKLRGENANGDQDFVEAYAKERKIPFYHQFQYGDFCF
ncbi:MAG: ATP-binding protein [Chitinophagales bacterium]